MVGVIIGTAGHVDHGKTALIKAMTGIDTDRLQEEKDRGLTVDLGFASLTLPSGQKVGVVDVPGHEKFMANMLAGITGMDLVMLIVDLTEGIMPQTREHMEIIDLLDIKNGLIVLTKADLVEEEWIELVKEEIRSELGASSFAKVPMAVVSAKTKEGIPELLTLLDELVANTQPKNENAALRLPIDRAFHMAGLGTIITGTLVSGQVSNGEEVELLPSGLKGRVRQIQIHSKNVEIAKAGQRVALSLPGIERGKINRGDVVTNPSTFKETRELDVLIKLLPDFNHSIKDNSLLHFHLGTARLLARVRFYNIWKLEPGEQALARLFLAEPVIASFQDPFIVRFYSPTKVMGGGRILVTHPPNFKRKNQQYIDMLERSSSGASVDLLLQMIKLQEVMSKKELFNKSNLTEDEFLASFELLNQATIVMPGDYLIIKEDYLNYRQKFIESLKDFHRRYNLRGGMAKSQAVSFFPPSLEGARADAILQAWQNEDLIKIEGNIISLPDFEAQPSLEQEKSLTGILEQLEAGGFSPPAVKELLLGKNENLLAYLEYLTSKGQIVKVSDELYFSQGNYQKALEGLKNFISKEGKITVADYRTALDTTRRYALALLERFDELRITRRQGDERILIQK